MSVESTIRIRPMVATDLDALVEISAELHHAPQWPRRTYEAILGQSAPKRIGLIAEDLRTGAIVGFAVGLLVPPEAELESIGVVAGYQRQGTARRLFEAVTAELSRVQVRQVVLEVRESNEAARSFYASLGFVEEGRRPGYYADPVEDAILMKLNLRSALAMGTKRQVHTDR